LHYTGKIDHCKIDFFFIGEKLWGISMEVELTLKQEVIELVRIRAIEGVQNAGLQLMRFWYQFSVKVFQ